MYIYPLFLFLWFLSVGLLAKEVNPAEKEDQTLSALHLPEVPPLDFQKLESIDVPKGKAGNWEWKNSSHTIRSAKGSHAIWESSYTIHFPDESMITKHKIPKTNINQYTYKKKNRGSLVYYDIVHPNFWGEEQTRIGVFDITYSPKWSLVVDSIRETNRISEFLNFSEEQFGFRAERIKVILHESKENFGFMQEKILIQRKTAQGFPMEVFLLSVHFQESFWKQKETQSLIHF